MSPLLRRTSKVACFYCNSPQLPRSPQSFQCSECACWNRYDTHGEIISDDPAMHDENLNAPSFAKRASPRKDRLPSVYGQALFCHTCQTNQMLIANLLSNYLPSQDDPEYTRRTELLPAYRQSVETRYPPVCHNCLPAVEEEIKKRDYMARTSALGGFLQKSRGKGKQRQVSVSLQEKHRLDRELVVWRFRGAAWVVGWVSSVTAYGAVIAGYGPPHLSQRFATALPLLVLLSIIWTVWDPTYASLKKAQLQGREVRQRGKREYNILQLIVWMSRLMSSLALALPSYRSSLDDLPSTPTRWYTCLSLSLELAVLIRSATILRVERPPPVQLQARFSHRPSSFYDPSSSSVSPPFSRPSTPALGTDPDLLSTLSLSNKPILAHTATGNPIFGIPSLPVGGRQDGGDVSLNAMDEDEEEERERDPNAMDWSPLSPARNRHQNQNHHAPAADASSSAFFVRPQRFFAPEEPTGLENLFAKTIKLADDDRMDGGARQGESRRRRSRSPWGGRGRSRWKTVGRWVVMGVVVLVVPALLGAAGYRVWDVRRRARDGAGGGGAVSMGLDVPVVVVLDTDVGTGGGGPEENS